MMEFDYYFRTSKESLKNNISSIMNNAFSESSEMTGGRPSSHTFTFAYSEGLKALQSDVITLIGDSFKNFHRTKKSIVMVRKESFNIFKDCFEFIFEKYKNTYGIGKGQYQNSFNKIVFEINKAIENQKLMLNENEKKNRENFWKWIIPIIIAIIPLFLALPNETKQTLWNRVSELCQWYVYLGN